MTTIKDHCLFFKDKQNLVINDNLNDQFINFNLNQNNHHCVEVVQSQNIQNCIIFNNDYSHKNDSQTRQNSTSFGKTKLGTSFANLNFQNYYGKKEESKEGKPLNANNSTLSLHITAYENSIDATLGDSINGGKDETRKKKGNISSIKNLKSFKESIKGSASVVKYAFELPRQQQDQNNDLEVMQFKASQRLSNFNGEASSSNAEHANNMDQNITTEKMNTSLNSVNSRNEEDEEEVLIEPRFKYHRILGTMPDRDTISCFTIHDKFIAVGCSSGRIRIFDILGNLRSEFTVKKHKCSVSQICVDRSGSYLITCANDSTVSIMGVGCNEYNYTVTLRQSARSIGIVEDFTKKGNQKFVTGEKQLRIFEKGFFGIYNDKIIYDGKDPDGYIHAISWKGDAIAFTNETGTRIYDCKLGRFLVLIQPLHSPEKYYSSRFPPLHSWFDDDTIAIGWGTNVVVAGVKYVQQEPPAMPIKRVEVLHRLKLSNFHVAGVSFTIQPQPSATDKKERKWKEIVIFGIKLAENRRKSGDNFDDTASAISGVSTYSMAPSVMALQIKPTQHVSIELLLALPTEVDNYIIAAEDEISMKQSEQMFLRQFHLGAMAEDGVYYLLGPRELIEARPCSVEDRIAWFLDNEFYVEATNCALAHREELHETSVSEVGKKLVEKLIAEENFDSAASYLPVICGRHKDEWEYYVGEFEKHGHVLKLVPFLPMKQPQLEPECYEYVLIAALYSKASLFLKLILLLPSDLYRIGAVIQRTMSKLKDLDLSKEDRIYLLQALARLYAHERQFDKALQLYLTLKDSGIFAFIRQYHLFKAVKGNIVQLVGINADLAIRLILDHEAEFVDSGTGTVVTQLSGIPKVQMEYLNQLMQRGEGLEHSNLLIRLYAEHAPDRLLPFLRKFDSYDIHRAIEVCKKFKLQPELVFLLGRSGNKVAALETIVEQMNRVDLAIEFCAEHMDEDLWSRLIELAMNKPEHVTAILTVAGTYVDPLVVIEKIPPTMQVPKLQQSLHKVLRDSKLQVGLIQDCQEVRFNDVFNLFEKFIKQPAIVVDSVDECCVCKKKVDKIVAELMIFGCGHFLHSKCRPPIPRKTSLSATNDEDLCKRQTFIAFDPNDPDPIPIDDCPICHHTRLIQT